MTMNSLVPFLSFPCSLVGVKTCPHLVPGFPVTLISTCFIGTEKKQVNSNTLRFERRLVRAFPRAAFTPKNFISGL